MVSRAAENGRDFFYPMKVNRNYIVPILAALGIVFLLVIGRALSSRGAPSSVLTLAAYTTPREVYREIIPLFQSFWKEKTGQDVVVRSSFLGSGAQSRAIEGGFEADVAALSLEPDITRLKRAGLITHDWQNNDAQGIVSRSRVAFAVREGNPRNVRDWGDLIQSDIKLVTPNPKTSGGAQWNFLALYGAAKRGFVPGYSSDKEGAQAFATALIKNVLVLDKGARESLINFERGVGDGNYPSFSVLLERKDRSGCGCSEFFSW